MLHTVKSLIRRGKRRCGVCLFELSRQAKLLGTDVDLDWQLAFSSSDSHKFTVDSLAASASRGCEQCKALLSAFQQLETTAFTTAAWCPSLNAAGGASHHVLRVGEQGQEFQLCTSSEHVLHKGEPSLHPVVCKGFKISGTTGDSKALGQGAEWLANCRRNHKQCRGGDSGFAPTRLLFLGGEEAGIVRLIENPPPSSSLYAALSHRWTQETLVSSLETSNLLRRRQDGIPMSDFPQMMQDVIHVLRQLGIDHVWIDCMCIVQDDKDDWRREAATMASVYANAELIVAATWCSSSGQSLFRHRRGLRHSAPDIAHIDGQSVFLRQALPHFTWDDIEYSWFSDNPSIDPELEWPLLSRGWVYQEQLLSRRVLHFTRHELLWECYESTRCECGWHEEGHDLPEAVRQGNKNPAASKTWGQITKAHSKRDLTFSSDRLPSLSGIAKTIAKSKAYSPASYLCGLWADELADSFFWYLSEPSNVPRLDIKMPTWSWASVAGNIDC